ncbi:MULTISPECIES: hypothetical protein [Maricaulis]|jgi:hypothetical protein|uniref:Uncharacterized protein n=1 Tax=Maricaulis maris (strain MCS10) TaxID=394221 RepID=Q0AP63_MARMM|nr:MULTISPECIES: hypothetical protein [Maricaulis]ABI65924.1 hypothetical protein Mmar10_1632 [Maricaulis maris MCS10]MAC89190.1 hypothetical protein [Maricaulis sp.]
MSLIYLLAGSVLGVSVMVLINAWLGISRPARLVDLDDAARRLDADRVGFDAGEGVLAVDGAAALIAERSGDCLGLLVARGSDLVIRYLVPGSVRDAVVEEGSAVRLRLNDFVFAPARLRFSTADEASLWAGRLSDLQPVARA